MCEHPEKTAPLLCHHISVQHKHRCYTIDTFLGLLCINWKLILPDRHVYHCKICDEFTAECNNEGRREFQKHLLFEFGLSHSQDENRDTDLAGNVELIREVAEEFSPDEFRESFENARSNFYKGNLFKRKKIIEQN